MNLTTPDSIRTLQRKLHLKAKAEPNYRFYLLYDKVYRADVLRHAYDLVRANRGAPGVDGVSCAVISPLLANRYMNRFLGHWRNQGRGEAFQAHVVNYADDFVIFSRGYAEEALAWTRRVMNRLGLTVNETKTVVRDARQERFDFLGYNYGPHHYRRPCSGNVVQRFCCSAEQDRIHHRFVVEGDVCDRRRDGEYDVEVGYRQQLGLARLQPFGARRSLALRTVPIAARVAGVASEPAVGAAFDMPAQCRRPARLDRRHDAALGAAEMVGVDLPERCAVAAENIRHLQRRAHRPAQAGGVTSSRSRSGGLGVRRIVLVATRV